MKARPECKPRDRRWTQRPLDSLENLILESLDPGAMSRSLGLPHPLSKFAVDGVVKEGPYADGILGFVSDWTWEARESVRHRAATWFLFESEMAFFRACAEGGIHGERLRSHLEERRKTNAL